MKQFFIKIADFMNRWASERKTGQMTIIVEYNQGGIRLVEVIEKVRLDLK